MSLRYEQALLRKTLTIVTDALDGGGRRQQRSGTGAVPEAPRERAAADSSRKPEMRDGAERGQKASLDEESRPDGRSTRAQPNQPSQNPGNNSDQGAAPPDIDLDQEAADWMQNVPWEEAGHANATESKDKAATGAGTGQGFFEQGDHDAGDFLADLPWEGSEKAGQSMGNKGSASGKSQEQGEEDAASFFEDLDWEGTEKTGEPMRQTASATGSRKEQGEEDAASFLEDLDWEGRGQGTGREDTQPDSDSRVSVDPTTDSDVPEHVEKLMQGRAGDASLDPLGDAIDRSQKPRGQHGDKKG